MESVLIDKQNEYKIEQHINIQRDGKSIMKPIRYESNITIHTKTQYYVIYAIIRLTSTI